jgi:phosphoribosylformylglycinamidine synthase
MRVRVLIMPKAGVLDPEGRAVQRALHELGFAEVRDAQTGKLVTLELDTADPEHARRLAGEMCEKLLANPVIEQYEIALLDQETQRP